MVRLYNILSGWIFWSHNWRKWRTGTCYCALSTFMSFLRQRTVLARTSLFSFTSFQSERCRINSCKPTRFIHWLLFFIQFSFTLCSLSSSLGFGYLSVQHSEPFTCQFSSTSPIEDTPPLNSRTTIHAVHFTLESPLNPFLGRFSPRMWCKLSLRFWLGPSTAVWSIIISTT